MNSNSTAARWVAIAVRAALGVFAFIGAITLAAILVMNRPKPETRDISRDVVVVQTYVAEPVFMPRTWTGYGTTRALGRAEVSAEVAGRVIEKPELIEAGVLVRAGDVLLRLDPGEYANQVDWHERTVEQISLEIGTLNLQEIRLKERLEFAEDDVAIKERDYRRVSDALEEGVANTLEVENKLTALNAVRRERTQILEQLDTVSTRRGALEARMNGEKAMMDNASINLERTTIRAPISGRVVEISARVGDRLSVNAPVAVIVDQSRVEVPVRLPVSAAGAVSINDAVMIEAQTSGVGHRQWEGTVQRISPEADPQTRTITAYAVVTQDPSSTGPLLLPGVFVTASVESALSEPVIVVPRAAVSRNAVFVVNGEQRVHRHKVDVLFTAQAERVPIASRSGYTGEWVAIASGVQPGDTVVTSNLAELSDGSEIRTATLDADSTNIGTPGERAGGGS